MFNGLEIQNIEKLKPELRRSSMGRRSRFEAALVQYIKDNRQITTSIQGYPGC